MNQIDKYQQYEIIKEIGSGSYSSVYKAKKKDEDILVAIKELRNGMTTEGFSTTSLREIQLLQEIKHQNIIKIIEIIYNKDKFIEQSSSVAIVFEYMPHDLSSFIKNQEIYSQVTQGQLKGYMKQILEAIQFLHKNNIMHRDIKSSNILISNDNIIKLTDFGLARRKNDIGCYTKHMVTLWYRSPELLLGEERYGNEVDLWSIGCVFMEMYIRSPLFNGHDELEQLNQIWNMCGTPIEEDKEFFMGYTHFQRFEFPMERESIIQKKYKSVVDETLMDLILQFLQLNPTKRISTENALQHKWFTSDPLPLQPNQMISFPDSVEMYYETYLKNNIIRPEAISSIDDQHMCGYNESREFNQERHNRSHSREYQRNPKYYQNNQNNQNGQYQRFNRNERGRGNFRGNRQNRFNRNNQQGNYNNNNNFNNNYNRNYNNYNNQSYQQNQNRQQQSNYQSYSQKYNQQ